MRILIVSVFSNHFFNWILQLKESGHEVYWIDVHDADTYVQRIDFVHQTVKWKRKIDYPGRHWLKHNVPKVDSLINKLNHRKFIGVFKSKINELRPDVVQSFEMHSACVPILEVMNSNPDIKWIYSAWGNDLYFYQNDPDRLKGIKAVFNRLDFMFADCTRDYIIAKKHGFKGKYLGTFPGGGGYDLDFSNHWLNKFKDRKIILVKGYQHKFGRCINVLEAIRDIEEELKDYDIVVFAATEEVFKFVEIPGNDKIKNLTIKGPIGRDEVLGLMGKSIIYIGNSISDGMPNTLLEAIIMEAFPIQSNPGGATAEIIEHGKNGYLIENPENSGEIAMLIKKAIQNVNLLKSGIEYNRKNIKPQLEREFVKKEVLKKYALLEQSI